MNTTIKLRKRFRLTRSSRLRSINKNPKSNVGCKRDETLEVMLYLIFSDSGTVVCEEFRDNVGAETFWDHRAMERRRGRYR